METAGIVAQHHQRAQTRCRDDRLDRHWSRIYSRLRELGHDNVISVRSGRRARDDKQYVNKRAEMWADMKSGSKSALPDAE